MNFGADYQRYLAGIWDTLLNIYLGFFTAVLTYISSTEQSRRSNAPLTAAVVYALRTIRSALDRGGIGSIEGTHILPGIVSTSAPLPMTFCRVGGINSLNLWSEECLQIVDDILQWQASSFLLNEFRLSLIAALSIDSTKEAHTRSIFADILKHTSIINTTFQFSDAYDHGKLAVYLYMAVTQKPLTEELDPPIALYHVIGKTITKHLKLQLPGLHIMEIAVKHVHNMAPTSPDWLIKRPDGLVIHEPGRNFGNWLWDIDH